MKKFAAYIFAFLALTLASAAHATPIKWNLSGVTFSDSTSLTGSFFYDASTGAYSNWSLTTSAGVLSAFTYNNADSSVFGLSNATELLVNSGLARYINLNFVGPLTAAGGSVALELATSFTSITTGSWECNNCGTYRWVTAGAVTTSDVPEPGSIALLGVALAALGVSRRQRT